MTQGFCGFLLLPGGGGGYGKGAGCRAGAVPWFRCVILCLQIIVKIKIVNPIKGP